MPRKVKVILLVCTASAVLLLALLGAIPYAFFLQVLALSADGAAADGLFWALYTVVCVLLWYLVWRIASVAVRRWPGRG